MFLISPTHGTYLVPSTTLNFITPQKMCEEYRLWSYYTNDLTLLFTFFPSLHIFSSANYSLRNLPANLQWTTKHSKTFHFKGTSASMSCPLPRNLGPPTQSFCNCRYRTNRTLVTIAAIIVNYHTCSGILKNVQQHAKLHLSTS